MVNKQTTEVNTKENSEVKNVYFVIKTYLVGLIFTLFAQPIIKEIIHNNL